MTMLHRVESYDSIDQFDDPRYPPPSVLLSFDTKYRGYWQCYVTRDEIRPAEGEPAIEMLTRDERETIEKLAPVVWAMIYRREA